MVNKQQVLAVSCCSETGACIAGNYTVIDDVSRDVSNGIGGSCDASLNDGWYRFLLGGADAVMPTACVSVTKSSFVFLFVFYYYVGMAWSGRTGHRQWSQ